MTPATQEYAMPKKIRAIKINFKLWQREHSDMGRAAKRWKLTSLCLESEAVKMKSMDIGKGPVYWNKATFEL